jgi:hypothetical protein
VPRNVAYGETQAQNTTHLRVESRGGEISCGVGAIPFRRHRGPEIFIGCCLGIEIRGLELEEQL